MKLLASLIVLWALVALAACGTLIDPTDWDCEYNYDVSWSTGGYAASSGHIKVDSYEYLDDGAIRGIRTDNCNEFLVSVSKGVIAVRSR